MLTVIYRSKRKTVRITTEHLQIQSRCFIEDKGNTLNFITLLWATESSNLKHKQSLSLFLIKEYWRSERSYMYSHSSLSISQSLDTEYNYLSFTTVVEQWVKGIRYCMYYIKMKGGLLRSSFSLFVHSLPHEKEEKRKATNRTHSKMTFKFVP